MLEDYQLLISRPPCPTIPLVDSRNLIALDTFHKVRGILQYLSFCDWFISPNMRSSKLIHVVENCKIPFLFMKTTSGEVISHCASHHLL